MKLAETKNFTTNLEYEVYLYKEAKSARYQSLYVNENDRNLKIYIDGFNNLRRLDCTIHESTYLAITSKYGATIKRIK